MKISLDYDNTLNDMESILLMLVNFKHGTSLKLEDVSNWNWFQENGYEKDFWAIYDLCDKTYLRRAMPPADPFAPAVVKWLQRRGHDVDIVTMNRKEAFPSIKGWLFMQGIDAPLKLKGRISPGEKVRLNYDIFIDDSPMLVEPILKAPSKRLVLYTRPWNKGIKTGKNIFRANNWLEIKDILEKLGV